MSLKLLISLKFVLYITGVTALYFLTSATGSSYEELLHQNKDMRNQIELYEMVYKANKSAEETAKALERVKMISLSDNADTIDVKSFYTHLTYLTLFLIVWFGVFSYLDDKIEKKKIIINDTGELL